jgi:hypothetical protein
MGNRKGIIYAAIERLDTLMAIGESRRDAKVALRQTAEEPMWTVSTGKIHSYTTREVYQQHILHFIDWCRTTYGVNRLDHLDERADELACAYLKHRLQEGRSAYTLQAERSACSLPIAVWQPLSLFLSVRVRRSLVLVERPDKISTSNLTTGKILSRFLKPVAYDEKRYVTCLFVRFM